jgi:hypothetical protein
VVRWRRPGLHEQVSPDQLRYCLGGQPRNLTRIGAVLRGLVEDSLDQVAELYGRSHIVFHGAPPRHGRSARPFRVQHQLQQIRGHRFVRSKFSTLQRKPTFALADSLKVK